MADISNCIANHLVRRARLWRWGSLVVIAPLAGIMVAAGAPLLALAALPAWLACRRAGRLALAGAAGEMAALKALERLPADHIVFNQVRLPCPAAREGFLEADYVVVAPHRVAVVEVKHNSGEIRASVKDKTWDVSRRRGDTTMRSPALQVLRHVAALGGWLRGNGAPGVWVEPAVFFSHPAASYRHTRQTAASNVSLVGPTELAAYFAFSQPTDRPVDQAAVVASIKALRAWDRARAAGHAAPPPATPPLARQPSPAPSSPPTKVALAPPVPSPGFLPVAGSAPRRQRTP